MKVNIWKTLCVCGICCLAGCYNVGTPREEILKVYNWADYIDEQVLEEFPAWYKEQTGKTIRIVYQVFDINEVMLTKIERGHEDFDVVCPSEYIVERMLKRDLLLPIDTNFGKTPNYLKNQSPYVRKQLNKISQPGRLASDYALGYMWGTTGILYNTKHVSRQEASTWGSLWNTKYEQKVLMKDGYRDVYSVVQIYAHRDDLASAQVSMDQLMNDYSDASISTVERYLKAMKPQIAGWEVDFGKEMMTKGKAWLNLTWSGDAVWAIEAASEVGVELDYVVPREGSCVWYDAWVIPKYARNRKAASYFINYLCRSDVAVRNMEAIGYVSAVATPEILEAQIDSTLDYDSDLSYFFGPIAQRVQVDKVLYPDRAEVERCAMMRDAGDRTEAIFGMWSRVKGSNLNTGIVVLILLTTALLFIYSIYKRIRNYRRQKKQRRRKRR